MSLKCTLCQSDITINKSKEHIIPNALGGRKEIENFICNSCNKKTGREWDVHLINQLHCLCLYFRISRQRNYTPTKTFKTITGQKYKLDRYGKLSVETQCEISNIDEKTKNVKLTTPNTKEANSHIKNLKRKYPNIEMDDLKSMRYFVKEPILFDLTIGGDESGKSIVKSALALAIDAGIKSNDCKDAVNYLISGGEPCYGFYHDGTDFIQNRDELDGNIPLHCVYIEGNPKSHLLLGYVEYFGLYRIVVCLSHNYNGVSTNKYYAINPISGTEIKNISIRLDLECNDVLDCYKYKKYVDKEILNIFKNIMNHYQRKYHLESLNKEVERSIKIALDKCGAKKGDTLNKDHIVNPIVI